MRKDIILPGLALVGGAAGFLLRKWQLSSAFHEETGLFTHGSPATYGLLGVIALALILFLLLLAGKTNIPRDFLPAFGSPEAGQMTVWAAAGLLFLAAGLLNLMEGGQLLQLWQATSPLDRDPTQLTLAGARVLGALLCFPAGAGVLLMGRSAYRWEVPESLGYLASMPAFAGLLWLFSTHLEHGTEPVLMRYGFTLSAAAFLMLAHYYFAGFLFERPRPRRALFFALSGIVLGLTSLADGLSLGLSVLTLAFLLSALGFARALLVSAYGSGWPDRMPSGAEDCEDREDQAQS